MRNRLIFGSLFIALLLALIYADARLQQPLQDASAANGAAFRYDGLLVLIVLAALVFLATREMSALISAAGCAPILRWPIVVNLSLVVLPFIAANAANDPAARALMDHHGTLVILTLAFMGAGVGVAARRKTDGAINAMGATLLNIAYIGLLAPFILRIRLYGPPGASWLLLYYIGTVKICDIGAYFTGRALGRHKLIEWLSPKKTIEGLAGGVTASVLVAVGVPLIVRQVTESAELAARFPGIGRAILFGVAMAVVGHAGDLLESLFKRDAKAKDSAAAVPAFGGVLDIIDSPLLTAPVAFWILTAA